MITNNGGNRNPSRPSVGGHGRFGSMKSVKLVEEGRCRFRVVPEPPQNQEAFRGPTRELVEHLEQVVEGTVVTEEPAPVDIRVRYAPEDGLGREKFRIVTDSDSINLTGSTIGALYHAVYFFLEECFGIRWLWPGLLGTEIPKWKNVAWPLGRVEKEPAFAWRWLGTGGAVWERHDPDFALRSFCRIDPEAQEDFRSWSRRMRNGGLRVADGHRWGQSCSPEKYGKTHPEYFALSGKKRDIEPGDGKHGNQPCTTRPEVVDFVADNVIAHFTASPELDAFSISINDGRGFCECDDCRKIDEWAGSEAHAEDEVDRGTREVPPGVGEGGRAITDRIFRFANEIAEKVHRRYPERLLLIHVYSLFRTPPKRMRLAPGIIAQFATPTPEQADGAFFKRERETLTEVSRHVERLGIYDYFEYGKRGGIPVVFPHTIGKSIKAFYQAGARYYATQSGNGFSISGLNYYVVSRLLWNPDADVETLIDDYCTNAFGAAAKRMRVFYESFEARWEAVTRGGSGGSLDMEHLVLSLYPSSFLLDMQRQLDECLNVEGLSRRHRGRLAFVSEGLTFIWHLREVCQGVVDLENLGLPPKAASRVWRDAMESVPHEKAKETLDAALLARARLLSYARDQGGRFVYSEFWLFYYIWKRNSQIDALSSMEKQFRAG